MKESVLWLLTAVLAAGCADKSKTQEPPKEKESVIGRLVKAADVGSDASFQALLADRKHRGDLTAPAALRELFGRLQVTRLSVEQGYSHDGGRAALFWWFNEVGVVGDAGAIRATITDFMKSRQFNAGSADDKAMTFTQWGDVVAQKVVIHGPRAWVGASTTTCGLEMNWTVQDRDSSPQIPLSEVIRQIPVLKDERLEAKVYDSLAQAVPSYVSVGGRWVQYYRWTTILAAPDSTLHDFIVRMLLDSGYRLTDTRSGMETYQRPSTRSYAWLSPVRDRQLVEFRVQPDS